MLKTKILIADTHILTREGVKSLLLKRKDLTATGEAINSEALFKAIAKVHPDIIIIDYHIEGSFSINDIARINSEYPDVRILIISANQKKEDVLKVLDYDINGYLLKECDEEEVLSAVYAAAKREKFFCGRVMDAILEKVKHAGNAVLAPEECQPVSLSEREVEIIKLIAEGFTTKRIAEKLFLSFHTIGTHRKNIFKKLRISSSSELIRYAIQKGIVSSSNN